MVNILDIKKTPYRSILNIIVEFPDIISFRHLRYVLVDDDYEKSKSPQAQHNIALIKNDFKNSKFEKLISSKRVKKNCITSTQNLSKYLCNLKNPPLSMLYKDENSIYHITNYGFLRVENIESLESYPLDHIKKFDTKDNLETHLIYGLSEKLYNELKGEEKEELKKNLDKIDDSFNNIFKIKKEFLNRLTKKLLDDFITYTNNKKIIDITPEENRILVGGITRQIAINYFNGIDICKSKKLFLNAFGIPYKNNNYIEAGLAIPKKIMYFYKKGKNIEKFCKVWSKSFLGKKHSLTFKDIKKIIEWGWNHQESLKMYIPYDIAYSRFSIIEPHLTNF